MKQFYLTMALIFLILGYSWSKYRLDLHVTERGNFDDYRFLPTPKLAKILSFGFENAVADIYWVEGINYYGSELSNKARKYTYLEAYCDLILALDPYFASFYDWASTAFIYTGLPITRHSIVLSTRFLNEGIKNLHSIYRYEANIFLKGAFNYALESHVFKPSLNYFSFLARAFPEKREMFLVGSTYAAHANEPNRSAEMKAEFLGNMAFEVANKQDLRYAINVLSSSDMNAKAAEFVRSLRIRIEADEDVRKLVERRLAANPVLQNAMLASVDLFRDRRLENILTIDPNKTWMPTEMLVLFSL